VIQSPDLHHALFHRVGFAPVCYRPDFLLVRCYAFTVYRYPFGSFPVVESEARQLAVSRAGYRTFVLVYLQFQLLFNLGAYTGHYPFACTLAFYVDAAVVRITHKTVPPFSSSLSSLSRIILKVMDLEGRLVVRLPCWVSISRLPVWLPEVSCG